MTLREVLAEGTALLRSPDTLSPGPYAHIQTPGLDASLLLADILKTDRAGLMAAGPEPINEDIRNRYIGSLKRRLSGECVAYILGRKEFRGLDFTVSPDVLVPRPDTETLVEAALAWLDSRPPPQKTAVLELCTGSGAVAVALKHERPHLDIYASDISAAALDIARTNARRLLSGAEMKTPAASGVVSSLDPVHFIHSDLFDKIPRRFHLILANPPYVPSAMISALSPEVRREPRLALDGGEDGLEVIRNLIPRAKARLYKGGMLLLEADPRQISTITGILRNNDFQGIEIRKDLSGLRRVIGGTVPF
jgi:release factor glutamine methyltransferase